VTLQTKHKAYHASFQILSADFRRITEFIEPVNAHRKTYRSAQ